MKKKKYIHYRDGIVVRRHNVRITIRHEGKLTLVEFERVVKESEIGKKFVQSGSQYTFKKAGICVLITKLRLPKEATEDVFYLLYWFLNDNEQIFTWSPKEQKDERSVARKAKSRNKKPAK